MMYAQRHPGVSDQRGQRNQDGGGDRIGHRNRAGDSGRGGCVSGGKRERIRQAHQRERPSVRVTGARTGDGAFQDLDCDMRERQRKQDRQA